MATVPQPTQTTNRPSRLNAPIFWGFVLVVLGVVFLALSLGILPNPSGAAVGAAFVVAGAAVLAAYLVLHAHWWTLIVGPALLGLGGAILLPGTGGGAIFLGAMGVGFALVALTDADRWWAVIPAGSLLTLALVALSTPVIGGLMGGALLFLGLAATFAVLGLIRRHGQVMKWPVYPALSCLLLAILVAATGQISAIVWPIVLVAAGVFFLARGLVKRA